jgi:hypothetical protein
LHCILIRPVSRGLQELAGGVGRGIHLEGADDIGVGIVEAVGIGMVSGVGLDGGGKMFPPNLMDGVPHTRIDTMTDEHSGGLHAVIVRYLSLKRMSLKLSSWSFMEPAIDLHRRP